jgi:hypothetical protein
VGALLSSFEERCQEIDAYLTLLAEIELQFETGVPRIGNVALTVMQQKIMYSSVYVQLYNLVEATVVKCVEAVADATVGRWKAPELRVELRKEWLRTEMRTHVELSPENRLATVVDVAERLLQAEPLRLWRIEKGGGGNWDEDGIREFSLRFGLEINVSKPTLTAVKTRRKDDRGAMQLVRHYRNELAHGSISFAECGDNVTVRDLRSIRDAVLNYLREVVGVFEQYLADFGFLSDASRPKE